jgi:hypothetical protein
MRPEVYRSETNPSEENHDKRSCKAAYDLQKFAIHTLARHDAVGINVTEMLFVGFLVIKMKSIAEGAVIEREGCDYAHVFNTIFLVADNSLSRIQVAR